MASASLLSSVPRSSISGRIQNLSVARKIAQASTAQRDGISHIHSAVLKLDDMTWQNADLVQSCGQAIDTMQREVAQLAQEVGVFQLEQQEDAAGRPVWPLCWRPHRL